MRSLFISSALVIFLGFVLWSYLSPAITFTAPRVQPKSIFCVVHSSGKFISQSGWPSMDACVAAGGEGKEILIFQGIASNGARRYTSFIGHTREEVKPKVRHRKDLPWPRGYAPADEGVEPRL